MRPSAAQLRTYIAANTTANPDALLADIQVRILRTLNDPVSIWFAVAEACEPFRRTMNQATRDMIAEQKDVELDGGTPEEIGRFIEQWWRTEADADMLASVAHIDLWAVDWLAVGAAMWQPTQLRLFDAA